MLAHLLAPFAFLGLWGTVVAGAAAVSVPVIIHLLNRRRFRVVVWAAMRFLLNAQKQNTRRMRLEQLILLAVRTTLVLLVVLAMASVTPWAEQLWASLWPDGGGFRPLRTSRLHKILVVDGSLSMAVRTKDGKTAFEHGRELALQIVKDAQPGDGLSVALMKDVPVWVVGEPALESAKVAREVEGLRQSHGNANVPAMLNMVAAKLAESGKRFDAREVYFITDLQKSTWLSGQAAADGAKKDGKESREKAVIAEIQKSATTIFVDVGRDKVTNVAVTDVTLGDSLVIAGATVPVLATVQNFGPEPREKLNVTLWVGRAAGQAGDPSVADRDGRAALRTQQQQLVKALPGEPVRVAFACKFPAAGTYAVQVRVEEDDLPADDGRTVIVTVRDNVPTLLVNGKPATDPFKEATFNLSFALNPLAPRLDLSPILPRVVSISQFADENQTRLTDYDCVWLCDVSKLNLGDLRRLEGHLRRGGGVVISLGEQVAEQIVGYNRLLYNKGEGILPAELQGVESAKPGTYYVLYAPNEAFSEPPLKAFADDNYRLTLSTPPFQRYMRVQPAADGRVRPILSFVPEAASPEKKDESKNLRTGDAAILEWNPPLPAEERARARAERQGPAGAAPAPASPTRYRGKVILVTTSLNLDWNRWPISPSYGAMMQELFRVAVSGRLRERSATVGQLLEEFLPVGSAKLDGRLYLPGLEKSPAKVRLGGADGQGVFRWTDADLAGVYRLLVGNQPQEYLFAVNVPTSSGDQRPSESDLARVTRDRLQGAFPAWDFQTVTDLRDVRHPDAPATSEGEAVRSNVGPAVAHWFLLGALVLLIAEVLLAWFFGHHTAVPGAAEPPRVGLLLPGVVGGVALVLFALIAFSLLHAAETGDFLSYLPDGFRSTVEGWLGVPPPAPGENTRWHLEFNPYLHSAANDPWLAGGLALLVLALVAAVYTFEAKTANGVYKGLLVGMRMFLILLTLAVLLPQIQLRFERQGWPDVVLLLDDSRSMGVPDHFRDEDVQKKADALAEQVRKRLLEDVPGRVKALQARHDAKKALGDKGDAAARAEAGQLAAVIRALDAQRLEVDSPNWRPSRLQLAQTLLGRKEPDWIGSLLAKRKMKVHIFHLDGHGRLVKLTDAEGKAAGEITDPAMQARARQAVADLVPTGSDSRLGTAVRQVLDYYRGASLTAVIMLTDGVTTRDETLAQVSEYAGQRGVPLFFVGIGDDHDVRDLKLHDLQVEDTVYVHDRVIFEARLTGRGYKDLTLPVVLKVREKDGKEKELDRQNVRIDPRGNPIKIQLKHQPDEPGEKLFIVEVEMPKLDPNEKAPNPADLRLQRTVFVQESKLIKVLYIEGTPRYEFRFIKSLLEREAPDKKRNKTIALKVLLADADDDFPKQDHTAISDFPATRQELFEYDVVILGDVDPRSRKLGDRRLKELADFVRERGGGLLMIAGSQFSPHAYKGTPLADVLPIEPTAQPAEPEDRTEGYRPELTSVGRRYPMFRFSSDDAENQDIWQRLAPLYWWSEGYRTKPLAEVLATHPRKRAEGKGPKDAEGHPLVVQHFVGAGRCMFFGFDETWRWRFREDERHFNHFWIQTVRYLSRSRISRTTVRLDRQAPYRVGEPIKVTVQFPDSRLVPGQKPGGKAPDKVDVKVLVEHKPPPGPDAETEIQTLQLAKAEGSWATYEGLLVRTREGKYKFTLVTPDVSKQQPSGERPSAEGVVIPPPGELDRLRMNVEELKQAAEATEGKFYTLAAADRVLEELPSGVRVVINTPRPPQPLWNHFLAFLLVLGLLASEWVLRKRKHLL